MHYSKHDFQAANNLVLLLSVLGLALLVAAIHPYLVNARYLRPMYGVVEPFIRPAPMLSSVIFLISACVLKIKVKQLEKETNPQKKED